MARHLPNLDGLRSLAALAVVLGHSHAFFQPGQAYLPPGWVEDAFFRQASLGVQFFFVLSGFLITRIALAQMDSSEGFRLGRFWLRRVLRIWPVYFLVVALSWLLARFAGPFFNMAYNQWPLVLCFLENFDLMAVVRGQHAPGFVVSVLWSVSIEEQFYFLYPLLLLALPRRAYVWLFGLVVLGAGTYKMSVLNTDPLAAQFSTFSACYELAIGCLLALLVHGREPQGQPAWRSLWPYLGLLLPFPPGWLPLLRPVCFAGIILDQAFCARSWLQTRFVPGLNWLGKLTYGIYSYHMIVLMLVYQVLQRFQAAPQGPWGFLAYLLLLLALTIGVSWTSYRWMERPILARAPR
ncbi:MAG: acyltransferase [Vulcanimicrobiota bacterium]